MDIEKIRELVSKLTLEEKASLTSGLDFWHTKPVERLGIPSVMVSDGPHGLRKQDDKADHLGVNESIKAVCFPAGCALASSFNKEMIEEMGSVIGKECQAEKLGVVLGPAVNIKRSPLCGRNFEYYSEDPYLASKCAESIIRGIQKEGVGTSIKHFCANNQETRRMSVSEEISERALHEIYLGAFEYAVKNARPWTVMSSYNRINGKYVGETKQLLTGVLRDEFGFDGIVMSDWGAVNDRVRDLEAGLELEMPGKGSEPDEEIVKAVKSGKLDEKVLDLACERMLTLIYRVIENRKEGVVFDRDADHVKAAEYAEECLVLLKNENSILPLRKQSRVAFIGKYAASPRYQGGGSSHINSHKVTSALAAAEALGYEVSYAQGFDDKEDKVDPAMESEALKLAAKSDVVVIFAGLPDAFESEGFDRTHLELPECQNSLISKIAAVQKNTVVVLHNGSPVTLPWLDKVDGLIEAYLGGQAVGEAEVKVLFGEVNPSGHLPETFPLKLSDNPSYLNFPGEGDKVVYAEDIFVGYRYYEKKQLPVRFPFGYGLSYTTFALENLKVDKSGISEKDTVTVTVDVRNTGTVKGKAVVQLYVGKLKSDVIRAEKELKGFEKVSLEPGETKSVTFTLTPREFSYYEERLPGWFIESGVYQIYAGFSSADTPLSAEVSINSSMRIPRKFTLDTTFMDLMADEKAASIIGPMMKLDGITGGDGAAASAAISKEMIMAMLQYMPLRGLSSFGGSNSVPKEQLLALLDMLNS